MILARVRKLSQRRTGQLSNPLTTKPQIRKRGTSLSTTRLSQAPFQPSLDLRPLAIQNAEIDRVTHPPSPRDQVPPERALFLRSDSQDGISRFLIQRVGLE